MALRDYTHGPLNTAVYVVPSLQSEAGCSVAANCLLNTGIWKDGDEFCYTSVSVIMLPEPYAHARSSSYTRLLEKDVSRYLGCRVVNMSPAFGHIILAPNSFPRSLKELASKDELFTWLIRLLFSILALPKPNNSQKVYYPSNLVAFIEILVHLHSVGFPTHWLSEVMQRILSDTVVTEIPLYRGRFPIPTSELTNRVKARKVCLNPWRVELETIIATSYDALPFPLTPPPDFSTQYADIGLFETTIPLDEFNEKTSIHPDILHAPNLPVITLIFYKVGQYPPSPMTLPFEIGDILEGARVGEPGKLYLLTCVERFSFRDGVIRWRMSKTRVREMKEENWVMISYRFDHSELGPSLG